MKSISELLRLKRNPYYQFTDDEQAVLNDFLSKQSEQTSQQTKNLVDSYKQTPATAQNKNIVHTDDGIIPQE